MPDRVLSTDEAAATAVTNALTNLLRALEDPDLLSGLDPALVQQLLAVSVALYARKLEHDGWISPFGDSRRAPAPTAGEVCAAVSQMLDAVSVEIFELALWRSWAAAADRTGTGG